MQLRVSSIGNIKESMWFDDSNKRQFIRISEKQFFQRYELIESLGKGSYGEVFKARSAHGNLVAIKQFKTQAVQQFHMIVREISNLKKLDHPNILKFYDCYIVDDHKYYMVTEFCPGGELTGFIRQISTDRGKLTICQQMAEGLAYAHGQGIVHRDLKPENILVGQRNVAKIGDFGCSTRLEDHANVFTSRVGSPAYMDYRVGRRQEYDHTADLYSLGMVFLWVFEGKGIYDECKGVTDLNYRQSQISKDYDNSIQGYIERLPVPIDAIVKNCLSPDYLNRYSAETIAAMIAARLSQDKSSTNLISTQDELDEMETEQVRFASRLMSLNKDFDRRYRNEKVRDAILRLLKHNQEALGKINELRELSYVSTDVKSQFTFLVFFYYLCWLKQISLAVQGEPSQVARRYPDLDPKAMEPDLLELIEKYIRQEQMRISTGLFKQAQKIHSTLHLLSKEKFLPAHFREFVRAAYQREPLPFQLLQEKEHLENVKEFFVKRMLPDYEYSRGNGQHDQRIKVIEKISQSFK